MFGATNIVENCDKAKSVYSGYDRAVWLGRVLVIIFLVLGKGPTYDINGSFGTAVKKLDIFTKENTKLCLSLH